MSLVSLLIFIVFSNVRVFGKMDKLSAYVPDVVKDSFTTLYLTGRIFKNAHVALLNSASKSSRNSVAIEIKNDMNKLESIFKKPGSFAEVGKDFMEKGTRLVNDCTKLAKNYVTDKAVNFFLFIYFYKIFACHK